MLAAMEIQTSAFFWGKSEGFPGNRRHSARKLTKHKFVIKDVICLTIMLVQVS